MYLGLETCCVSSPCCYHHFDVIWCVEVVFLGHGTYVKLVANWVVIECAEVVWELMLKVRV